MKTMHFALVNVNWMHFYITLTASLSYSLHDTKLIFTSHETTRARTASVPTIRNTNALVHYTNGKTTLIST